MTYVWVFLGLVVLLALYDLFQKKHAVLRNFPILGHFRYLFEMVGPELRQYIVTNNNEERPFSRDQRSWVYASAKKQNNYFGFGTDNDIENTPNYIIIKQGARPLPDNVSPMKGASPHYEIPCAKVLGESRGRAKAFRMPSIVNISAMSYGSLSHPAVSAINRGCEIAGCLHNTGEGGVAPYHDHGGELVWQIGTGYFGCRDAQGRFDLQKLKEVVAKYRVRAIEVKLSQGAKPGLGGVLPAAKITEEISRIRGVPQGADCISPPFHTAFEDEDSLLDFVEMIADETGLPVGIKSAIGTMDFWYRLANLMATTDRGVDFVAVDGGEGGTGAAPLAFSDYVSLPFKLGFPRVFRAFAEQGLQDSVVFIGAGRLGFPEAAIVAFALGCDSVAIAREAMLAIGCIQAQRCQTGHCPTGVATQNKWLVRGLDPVSKAARLANYIMILRKDLMRLSHACGVAHPALITSKHVEVLDGRMKSTSLKELFEYEERWGVPVADPDSLQELMKGEVV